MLPFLAAAFLAASPAPAHCTLHETNQLVHRWEGSCGRLLGHDSRVKLKPAKSIATGRWHADRAPSAVWAGIAKDSDDVVDLELEIYAGGTGALRTDDGWYPVDRYVATPSALTFDIDTATTIPPSELDREIVKRADVLLSTPSVWNRADNRRCPETAKTFSIYCAMEHGEMEVACGHHHRRPGAELVREIIEKKTEGRDYKHRLMDYNNDSTTTLADVHRIFADALTRMGGRPGEPLATTAACPADEPTTFGKADLMIVERAAALLGTESAWSKTGGQRCPPDAKTMGLYCAIDRAAVEVTGDAGDADAVLNEARAVIDFVASKRYGARLVDYNNDPAVSFADLQSFFRILRTRVTRRMAADG